MKTSSNCKHVCFSVLALMLAASPRAAFGQATLREVSAKVTAASAPVAHISSTVAASTPIRYVRPTFVGTFRADGIYVPATRSLVAPVADPYATGRARPVEVPPWIDLNSVERVVEDKRYKRQAAKPKSSLSHMFEHVVAAVYGRERVLLQPSHLVQDSRQRVIIADPAIPAIHVLDGKDSFRIEGGEGRRLQHPAAVAVDAADNIYVADDKLGRILVYDPDGVFIRFIGVYNDENMFERPTGIAIDRANGDLYVVDAGVHELVVLDLEGNIRTRVGGRRSSTVKFDHPTQVAIAPGRLAVLDGKCTAVKVYKTDFTLIAEIPIRVLTQDAPAPEMGLALDSLGNVFISNVLSSDLRVYSPEGKLIDTVRTSHEQDTFNTPSGMFIDSTGRMLLSDTGNSRIQIFQLSVPQGAGTEPMQLSRSH